MYNSSWDKWISASIGKHFKEALINAHIDNFIEGESTRDLTSSEYVEIRQDGIAATEGFKDDFTLRLEVNLLIQTIINPVKNFYRHKEVQGFCTSAMKHSIPVYKLGNRVLDDKTQFGCLTLDTDGSKGKVLAHNYGQIEMEIKLQQSTVEAHYKIELKGA